MTLMESMPRGQPATRDDTDALGARMDGLDQRMDAMEQRLNERIDLKTQSAADRVATTIHQSLAAQSRLYIFALVGALASIAALGFAT